jgi:hypothetical protein
MRFMVVIVDRSLSENEKNLIFFLIKSSPSETSLIQNFALMMLF